MVLVLGTPTTQYTHLTSMSTNFGTVYTGIYSIYLYILYIPGIPCLVQNVRTVTNRSTDWDEIARIIFSGIFSNSSLTPRCASD